MARQQRVVLVLVLLASLLDATVVRGQPSASVDTAGSVSAAVQSLAEGATSSGEVAAVAGVTSYALSLQAGRIDELVAMNTDLFRPFQHHVHTINDLANSFYEVSCDALKLLEHEKDNMLDLDSRLELMRDGFKRGDDRAVLRQLNGIKMRLKTTRDKVAALRVKHAAVRKGAEAEEVAIAQDMVKAAEDGQLQRKAGKNKKIAGRALLASSVVIVGPAVGAQMAMSGLAAAGASAVAAGGAGIHQLVQANKHHKYALGFEELGSDILELLRYNLNQTIGYLQGLELKYDAVIRSLEASESGVKVAKDTLGQDPPPDFSQGEVDSIFDRLTGVVSGVHGAADEFIAGFSVGLLPESVRQVLPAPPGLHVDEVEEPQG